MGDKENPLFLICKHLKNSVKKVIVMKIKNCIGIFQIINETGNRILINYLEWYNISRNSNSLNLNSNSINPYCTTYQNWSKIIHILDIINAIQFSNKILYN